MLMIVPHGQMTRSGNKNHEFYFRLVTLTPLSRNYIRSASRNSFPFSEFDINFFFVRFRPERLIEKFSKFSFTSSDER